jgi:predicted PurR-regulated permease PerM
MTPQPPPRDLARTTFQLLALGVLIFSVFAVVQPFLVAGTWAGMIAIATWPLLLRAEGLFGGSRRAAVAVMTVALLVILLLPFYFGISTIVEHADEIAELPKRVAELTFPQPPAWVDSVPLVGSAIAAAWQRAASSSPDELAHRLVPYAHVVAGWFVSQVGSLGVLLLQLLLTVVIVALLYANGETVAYGTDRLARRLAGVRAEDVVHLAARAIRAVALGVVVTAMVQSALVGIGLAVAGFRFVTVLVAIVFVLAIAQIGPIPVLLPATIWMYAKSGTLLGTLFLVWAIISGGIDNVLRPILIRRGADLPLLLVFAGVIGGLLAFGIIGLFIGPVVLAVAYTLLVAWVDDDPGDVAVSPPSP